MALAIDTIRATADRVAASHGLEVVDVEFAGGGGKHRALRVFVEKNAEGRAKLRAYGIAPPVPAGTRAVECPQCGSTATEEVSRFGSTPCKAQWRCRDCLEPFDLFKCH